MDATVRPGGRGGCTFECPGSTGRPTYSTRHLRLVGEENAEILGKHDKILLKGGNKRLYHRSGPETSVVLLPARAPLFHVSPSSARSE